jgi:hypothetical protein
MPGKKAARHADEVREHHAAEQLRERHTTARTAIRTAGAVVAAVAAAWVRARYGA